MLDDETQTGRKNTKERDATRSDSPARAEPGLEDATPSESIAGQRAPGHLRMKFKSQSSESRSKFNDSLDAMKSDLIDRIEAPRSGVNDSIRALSADFSDRLESQSEKLTAEFNAGIRVLEAEIKSLRREVRVVITLFSILTAIGLYSLFLERSEPQERPEPLIIVVPSAQLAQPDASRKLEWAVAYVRSQSREAERNAPNVVPDAEDPPNPAGPE